MSEKEKLDLFKFLNEMIKKFPNDQELGKNVRKYFIETQKIKNLNHGIQ
jgi:hypothetical protein